MGSTILPRLCYVTDGERGTAGRPLAGVIRSAIEGGVGLVILRERERSGADWVRLARELEPLRERGARIVASRRLDIARALHLDGVHLAADAIPIAEARVWLGAQALIGYSAHSSDEARRAADHGANYVTLSPIYPTGSKPGLSGRGCAWLREAIHGLSIPVFALGGITAERVREVRAAGAWGVAAVSAIGAAPDVTRAASELYTLLEESSA